MKRRTFGRRLMVFTCTAGAALLAVGGLARPAHATSDLLGWTVHADANVLDIVVDDSGGLGGVHPLNEADLPEANSDFESGPFGDALASVFWPGAVGGNLGSVSGELPIPSQLASLLGNTNDPVKAQAFYPAGPGTSSYPPSGQMSGVAEMKSEANGNGDAAQADLSDLTVPGLLEIKGAYGSTSAVAGSVAQGTASEAFSDLTLLGGLIDIGSTTSIASASSDGVSPSGTGTTHFGRITVAGHSTTFGSDGLVIGPVSTNLVNSLLSPTTAEIQQLISLLNLKVTELPQTVTSQAPAQSVTTGALLVSFSLPANAGVALDCAALPAGLESEVSALCSLPDVLQGLTISLTIARATASAVATPPFSGSLPSIPTVLPAPPSGSATVSTSPSDGSGVAIGSSGTGANSGESGPASGSTGSAPSLAATSGVASAPSQSGNGPGSLASLVPISLSTPVRAGLAALLLIVAAVAGGGLVRLTRLLEVSPPDPCPLEEVQ